jgi:CelD/BcsL family acetyltransferase involved in cellulose biosynthesis
VSQLRVERITTPGGLLELEAEWGALFDRVRPGLPFLSWTWLTAWWAHLRRESSLQVDELFVCALRTSSGELKAVAPLMLTRRPARGPLSVRALDFIGPDPNITELRGLLAEPAWQLEAYAALRRYLLDHHEEWDWVHWRGLRLGSAVHAALAAAPGVQAVGTIDNWLLPLPATWEQLRSSRSRNLKESLRKCYNSLRRDGHSFTLEVAQSPQAVEEALGRFLALHGARARLKGTVAHSDVFASQRARDFLDEVCARLAPAGGVRVFELVVAGEVVASRVGFAIGDTLYLYYSGYLPQWGAYSVMTTCVAEALRYAIEQGFKTANLSTGTDVSKLRWSPEQVRYAELVEVAPSARCRLAYPAYREVRRALVQTDLGRLAHLAWGRWAFRAEHHR